MSWFRSPAEGCSRESSHVVDGGGGPCGAWWRGRLHEQPMRSSLLTQKRAKVLRRNLTRPEQALWALLRRNRLGLHFRRQHALGPFILDFYCVLCPGGWTGVRGATRPRRAARRLACGTGHPDAPVLGRGGRTTACRGPRRHCSRGRPLHRLTPVPLPRFAVEERRLLPQAATSGTRRARAATKGNKSLGSSICGTRSISDFRRAVRSRT